MSEISADIRLDILSGLLNELERHNESKHIYLEWRGQRMTQNNFILTRKDIEGKKDLVPSAIYINGKSEIRELFTFMKGLFKKEKGLGERVYGRITKEDIEDRIEDALSDIAKEIKQTIDNTNNTYREDNKNILRQVVKLNKNRALILLVDIDSQKLSIEDKYFIRLMIRIIDNIPEKLYKKYVKEIEKVVKT